jgi:hypothetical protein
VDGNSRPTPVAAGKNLDLISCHSLCDQRASYDAAMQKSALTAAVLLLFIAARGMTQEHLHRDGETLGDVQFATSCNESAQSDFNRAVALLHSFQFSRAIDGFNAVLQEDPTCAIAYQRTANGLCTL